MTDNEASVIIQNWLKTTRNWHIRQSLYREHPEVEAHARKVLERAAQLGQVALVEDIDAAWIDSRGRTIARAIPTDVASRMLRVLERWTVDDISYETMSRIARRVRLLPRGASAVRVADIIAEEIGPEKALEYVEKAHAGGLITTSEYNELRAALILTLPRERIPVPRAAMGRMELLEAQKRLQKEFAALGEAGRAAVTTPMRALNKDVERLRRAWGG